MSITRVPKADFYSCEVRSKPFLELISQTNLSLNNEYSLKCLWNKLEHKEEKKKLYLHPLHQVVYSVLIYFPYLWSCLVHQNIMDRSKYRQLHQLALIPLCVYRQHRLRKKISHPFSTFIHVYQKNKSKAQKTQSSKGHRNWNWTKPSSTPGFEIEDDTNTLRNQKHWKLNWHNLDLSTIGVRYWVSTFLSCWIATTSSTSSSLSGACHFSWW